jgi:hypothetical protein
MFHVKHCARRRLGLPSFTGHPRLMFHVEHSVCQRAQCSTWNIRSCFLYLCAQSRSALNKSGLREFVVGKPIL